MASRAALAAALLMALVALGSASTFTTTVTTISSDEDSNPRYQQCRQQLQGRQFQPCQRYLQQRSSRPYSDEEDVLEMTTGDQQQQHLQQCCQQLKEMDQRQCGCEAIQHAVKQAQQQQGQGRYDESGSYGGRGSSRYDESGPYSSRRESRDYPRHQSEQIYQKARSLPRVCGLRQQRCSFRLVLA